MFDALKKSMIDAIEEGQLKLGLSRRDRFGCIIRWNPSVR